jgi:hypothetical protein
MAPLPGGVSALVWSGPSGIRASRVDRNGRLLGDPSIVLPCAPADGRVAVVATPTGAAVVFGARGQMWLRRLGPDAVPSSDAQRIWAKLPRPATAASVGGRIGMLAREEAGPVVETPDSGAIGVLVGSSIQEAPQILLTRYEGLPVIGPSLPWHSGAGAAVLGARREELATVAASEDGAFLTRIGLDAREIGIPIRLSAEGRETSAPAVAGADDAFLASWTEGGAVQIALVRIGRDGTPAVTALDGAVDTGVTDVALAAGAGGFAVAGRSGADLAVVRLDRQGRRRGRPTSVPGAFASEGRPVAGFIGPNLVVALPGDPPRVVAIDPGGRVLGSR